MPPAASPSTPSTAPQVAAPPGLFRRLGTLASLHGRYHILHLTTLAFFLSFLVWFDMAPFAKQIGTELHLSKSQLVTLSLCNLALTVPARIGVGMLLDRFGPRRVFAGILIFAVVPNTIFATASSYPVLVFSRLVLGVVGAGFVVGIRMVRVLFLTIAGCAAVMALLTWLMPEPQGVTGVTNTAPRMASAVPASTG